MTLLETIISLSILAFSLLSFVEGLSKVGNLLKENNKKYRLAEDSFIKDPFSDHLCSNIQIAQKNLIKCNDISTSSFLISP